MRSKLKPLIQKYVFKNFSKYVFVNTSVPISETVGDVTPVFARIIGPETSHTVRGGQDGLFFILQMRNLSLRTFLLPFLPLVLLSAHLLFTSMRDHT